MAPRLAREVADFDYSAVGKQGRRTGVTLDQQPLDVYGLEQVSGIFSSPRKPSPLKNMLVMNSVEEDETSITVRRPLSPSHLIRSTPRRPARSSSPRKSGISGTARKSNGVDIFSAHENLDDDDGEDREITPIPVYTPSIDATLALPKSVRIVQRVTPRRLSPSPHNPPIINTTPQKLPRTRPGLLMQEIENEIAPFIEGGRSDPYEEALEDVELVVQGNAYSALSYGRIKDVAITPPQRQASEKLEEPLVGFDADNPELDTDVEQPTPIVPQNKANSRKKRKSDAMDVEDAESPKPTKVPKKRGRPPTIRDATSPASSPKPMSAKGKGKQTLRDKNPNLKLSSRQEKELENIVEQVKARPGPPRSLYLLRRETRADDNVTHTRSGRVSVKPLAYWRNERCVYGSSPGGATLADGARFPLNSIKEIVRTEEIALSPSKKKLKGKKKAPTKARRVEEREEENPSDSDFDTDEVPVDPHAEPWELATGTLRGNVSIWDKAELAPTEQEEEIEIAHAPAAIKTREVKGSSLHDGPTFRYAKLLSTNFFGTGLVDLPPGGIKRPKNSRKMHMSFFVVKGRVTVSVGPLGGEESGSMSRFSIGKGGFWQVPRGNQYAIENEMEKPARIFFSQGCETEPGEVGEE